MASTLIIFAFVFPFILLREFLFINLTTPLLVGIVSHTSVLKGLTDILLDCVWLALPMVLHSFFLETELLALELYLEVFKVIFWNKLGSHLEYFDWDFVYFDINEEYFLAVDRGIVGWIEVCLDCELLFGLIRIYLLTV